eukprot:EG_transcript_16981
MLDNVVEFLSQHQGVTGVWLAPRPGTSAAEVREWEARHGRALPHDMRQFYARSNGLELRWSIQLGDRCIPLGHLNVNRLADVARLPSPAPSAPGAPTPGPGGAAPARDAFVVDDTKHCGGTVVACCTSTATMEMWFVALDGTWHFLAPDFTCYLRLAVTHLGLPGWGCAFTPYGLPSATRQWLHFLSPERCAIDEARPAPEQQPGTGARLIPNEEKGEVAAQQVDWAQLFALERERGKNPLAASGVPDGASGADAPKRAAKAAPGPRPAVVRKG